LTAIDAKLPLLLPHHQKFGLLTRPFFMSFHACSLSSKQNLSRLHQYLWSQSVPLGEYALKDLDGKHPLRLKFHTEKIVKNPKDEFSLIFDYLGLSFSENILEVQTNKRSVLTASDLQVREAIYDGSSNSWVKYEAYIQKFIQAFVR
jgi:hypothetical protein